MRHDEAKLSTARRVIDLLTESFFEGQAAIAAFVRADGRWDISVHFAEPPDQGAIRELVGLAAGDEAARDVSFDTVEAKDWVAATLEELVPVRAGRFVVHGRHDRKIEEVAKPAPAAILCDWRAVSKINGSTVCCG